MGQRGHPSCRHCFWFALFGPYMCIDTHTHTHTRARAARISSLLHTYAHTRISCADSFIHPFINAVASADAAVNDLETEDLETEDLDEIGLTRIPLTCPLPKFASQHMGNVTPLSLP